MQNYNALNIAHEYLREHIKIGDFVIDATAGRGNDTVLLAELVGVTGRVISFDIQEDAINSTRSLLMHNGLVDRVSLVHGGHENLSRHVLPNSISAITFNLGWLPSGDHSKFTRADTTIMAIEAGLEALKIGGIMTICIYYGRDCGFEEKEALMRYLPTIDFHKYTVLITDFANRPNNPPIPVLIKKEA